MGLGHNNKTERHRHQSEEAPEFTQLRPWLDVRGVLQKEGKHFCRIQFAFGIAAIGAEEGGWELLFGELRIFRGFIPV